LTAGSSDAAKGKGSGGLVRPWPGQQDLHVGDGKTQRECRLVKKKGVFTAWGTFSLNKSVKGVGMRGKWREGDEINGFAGWWVGV